MPVVYELFVLAKNSLSTSALKTLMRNTGRVILNAPASSTDEVPSPSPRSSSTGEQSQGVIMDVKCFGEQDLAYTIRRPGERHSSATMWQMTFGCHPSRIEEIERGLRLDEGVVRWSVLKRKYPFDDSLKMTSYRVAQKARELAESSSNT
jgi:ribosomal protein S6